MLRYDRQTNKPGLVALYDIRPGNGADPFLQRRSPHGAPKLRRWFWATPNQIHLLPSWLKVKKWTSLQFQTTRSSISDDFRWASQLCVVKFRRGYISSNSSNGQEFPRMIYCISTLLSFGQCLNTHVLFGTTISRHRSQIN